MRIERPVGMILGTGGTGGLLSGVVIGADLAGLVMMRTLVIMNHRPLVAV